MSKHELFRKRLNGLKKEYGLTNITLAEKIGYEEVTIKRWTRKNQENFPNISTLIKLSEIFDVDVQYLLGEQDCRKISSQRIVNLTGLNETASQKLVESPLISGVINDIMNSPLFNKLISDIYNYTHSHYVSLSLSDRAKAISDNTFINSKDALKFIATDTFSQILNELWAANSEEMEFAKDRNTLEDMLLSIKKHYDFALNNDNSMKRLITITETYIDMIEWDVLKNYLKQFTAKNIILHYKELAEKFHIDLSESVGEE